jgi:TonB-linked SusC/RagA family outer membrane protein
MQEFATRKAIAQRMDLRFLNCSFRKYRMAVRIMKLTTIILLAACLQLSARGLTQTVTISVKDAPLLTVLKAIEKQTDFVFFVNNKELQKTKKVSITANNLPLQQVLDMCFKDQPLTYTITGKWINIVPRIRKVEKDDKTSFAAPLPKTIDIRGRVVNEKGEPVLASITVKGTTKGTTTNKDGWFVLPGIDDNATLIISGVGIETTEINADGKTQLDIAVKISVRQLDDVQMIAYGATTKRFNTGNVSTVKGIDIAKQPVNNPLLALQGRVPGLTITQSTGVPGSAVAIHVQGRNNLNSFFTGSDPLIVIDGVPYPSQNLLTFQPGNTISVPSTILGASTGQFSAAGSTLAFINPDDIESIDILKDADATAIYGSRAANGAILITTKKGKDGEMKIDLNFQTGFGHIARKWDLLNKEQYLEMRHEAMQNDNSSILPTDYDLNGVWDTTRTTDWQKELIGGTANYTRATATLSAGNYNTKYLIGTTFSKEGTVFPGNFSNSRGNVHFNINSATENKRFQIQLSGSYMTDNNNIPGVDYTSFITLAPVAPKLYNNDGTLNWAPDSNGISTWDNPLSYKYNVFENKSTNLIGNSAVSYRLLPGLEIRTSLGYNNLLSNQFIAALDAAFKPETRSTLSRIATFTNNSIKTWIAEPQVAYTKTIKTYGRFEGLVGTTFQETTSDGIQTNAGGQTSDQLLKNLSAATSTSSNTINSSYRYNAIFGRLNYIHNNRYLVNLSGRRDGSSRFGKNNLVHNFGAIGVGWIFSEEGFIKNKIPILTYGKLRASYGIMGNDQIGDYKFMSLFRSTLNSIPYQTVQGLTSTGISNPYLQWEKTQKLQAGIEIGFLKDRGFLSVNFYQNRSSNTLTDVNLPIITGTGTFLDNFPALIENKGLEFSFRSENIKSSFSWTSSFNLTIPRNKLIKFPNIETSSSADVLIVGKSVNIVKTYSFYGIDPTSGEFLYNNSSGSTTTSPDFKNDRISIIDQSEKFYGGVSNTFIFKGFQLDVFIQFTKQVAYNNLNVNDLPGVFNVPNYILGNQPTTVLSRWRKPGDITQTPRYTSSFLDRPTSDWSYRDASFARLKNVSLSYKFSGKLCKRIRLKEGSVFANGQNLLTITSYKGLDPETQSITTLPPLRVVTFGVHVIL